MDSIGVLKSDLLPQMRDQDGRATSGGNGWPGAEFVNEFLIGEISPTSCAALIVACGTPWYSHERDA
jgi:hypothetical protein